MCTREESDGAGREKKEYGGMTYGMCKREEWEGEQGVQDTRLGGARKASTLEMKKKERVQKLMTAHGERRGRL